MIIRIFLWGAIITIPVFLLQMGAGKLINILALQNGFSDLGKSTYLPVSQLALVDFAIVIFYWIVVIAFTEELFKYFVIKLKIINSPELDEPLDIMLYMVIVALGFSAVENILYIFIPAGQMAFVPLLQRTMLLSFIRFIGGTFLHALCSAVVGYSLAIGLCKIKHRWVYTFLGLFMATLLHGFYDFSIISLEGDLKIITPIIILTILAVLTSFGFERLKKLKSVCSLKDIYGK